MSYCPRCGYTLEGSVSCPRCGYQTQTVAPAVYMARWGFEWKSRAQIFGIPLIHIAVGRNRETGRLMLARGIVAIGQFAVGLITISQFGVGLLFAFGQFTAGLIAIGQLAIGGYFGLGQFATGVVVIGQMAVGKYVLAQVGIGKYIWSQKVKDPVAIHFFRSLWDSILRYLAAIT